MNFAGEVAAFACALVWPWSSMRIRRMSGGRKQKISVDDDALRDTYSPAFVKAWTLA